MDDPKKRVVWYHTPMQHGEIVVNTISSDYCCAECCRTGYRIFGHDRCKPSSDCGPQPVVFRPEIDAFAREMEKRMRDNDHRLGWRGITAEDAIGYIHDNLWTLKLGVNHQTLTPDLVRRHAADLANYAMMLAFVAGGLAE